MIAAATCVPWAFAVLLMVSPRSRRVGAHMAIVAALPAALLALFARGAHVDWPWLLFGTRLAIDETAAVFMLCSAAIWIAAAVYARGALSSDANRHRFQIFLLWTMGAQLGLPASQDIPTFYLLYFVMTIAAYGLVVHDGSPRARHAGLIYLAMAIAAEGVLLPGLLLAANSAGTLEIAQTARALASSEHRDLIVGLLLAGFAVKAGLPPLHVWLPLAHPAAPTPASAVLSGVLINAGLLGWLRFLPLGEVDLPTWRDILLALGLVAALFGALLGTFQRDAKSALAYSSVSQMGWAVIVLGLGLGRSDEWHALAPLVLLFVAHHGLAKAALFLGVGVARSGALSPGVCVAFLAVPALAIAGAPGTTGAVVKSALKHALHAAPPALGDGLAWLITLAGFGTAIVLIRVLSLVGVRDDTHAHDPGQQSRPQILAWLALTLAIVLLPAFVPHEGLGSTSSVLPIALALLVGGAWRWRRWRVPFVPPGDILVPLDGLIVEAVGAAERRRSATPTPAPEQPPRAARAMAALGRIERRFAGQRAVAISFLALVLALAVAAAVFRAAA